MNGASSRWKTPKTRRSSGIGSAWSSTRRSQYGYSSAWTTWMPADWRPRRAAPASCPAPRPPRRRPAPPPPPEGAAHRLPPRSPRQDVAEADVAAPFHLPGPGDALIAGVGRRVAVAVDDGDLAQITAAVVLDQLLEGASGGEPLFQQGEPIDPQVG